MEEERPEEVFSAVETSLLKIKKSLKSEFPGWRIIIESRPKMRFFVLWRRRWLKKKLLAVVRLGESTEGWYLEAELYEGKVYLYIKDALEPISNSFGIPLTIFFSPLP